MAPGEAYEPDLRAGHVTPAADVLHHQLVLAIDHCNRRIQGSASRGGVASDDFEVGAEQRLEDGHQLLIRQNLGRRASERRHEITELPGWQCPAVPEPAWCEWVLAPGEQ